MDWHRADPAREIEGQINRLREDARCQQVQIEDAVCCELAAEGAAEAARSLPADGQVGPVTAVALG